MSALSTTSSADTLDRGVDRALEAARLFVVGEPQRAGLTIVEIKLLKGEGEQRQRIAGAALDVFEQEPVDPANPLLKMDNVIVTPHSLCWTDECYHNMASTGLQSIVDALRGLVPEFVVDREALKHPRVQAWRRSG